MDRVYKNENVSMRRCPGRKLVGTGHKGSSRQEMQTWNLSSFLAIESRLNEGGVGMG